MSDDTHWVLLQVDMLDAAGTVAWTRYDTVMFGHYCATWEIEAGRCASDEWVDWGGGDIADTWLQDIDPDPWRGRCRAKAQDGRPESEWSEWGYTDGTPVPVPEPSRTVLLLCGIAVLGALSVTGRKQR